MIEDDIAKVDPADIRRENLDGGDVDLLVVCAPCQPFSSQNRKRGADDRSRLILQAGKFARILRPRVIFFENVPGLAAQSDLLDELREKLGPDYHLGDPERVDAADFGVPQRRVRCIMMATRGASLQRFPRPSRQRASASRCGRQSATYRACEPANAIRTTTFTPRDDTRISRFDDWPQFRRMEGAAPRFLPTWD